MLTEVLLDNESLAKYAATFSISGSLFIIISWFLFPEQRIFTRKIIVWMAVMDLIGSATIYIGIGVHFADRDQHAIFCRNQSYVIMFCYLASFLWTWCFRSHLYILICKKERNPQKHAFMYHVVALVIPLMICTSIAARNVFNFYPIDTSPHNHLPWCWVADQSSMNEVTGKTFQELLTNGSLNEFVFFYLPFAFVVIVNLVTYLLIACNVTGTSMSATIRSRLFFYFLSLLLCTGVGLSRKIYEFYVVNVDDYAIQWLLRAESMAFPLQGALNSLFYGINGKILQRYKKFFCCCCGKSKAVIGEFTSAKSRNYDDDDAYDASDYLTDDEEDDPVEIFSDMSSNSLNDSLNTSLLSGTSGRKRSHESPYFMPA